MKNTLVLVVLVCLIQTAQAQIQIGIRGSFSQITAAETSKELTNVEPLEMLNLNYTSSSNQVSYGLMVHDENEKVFFSSELLYKKSKHNFELEDVMESLKRNEAVSEFSYQHTDLSIPLAAGLKVSNFKIGGGPIFNFRLNSENSLAQTESISSTDPKLNMGFQFLVGYIVNKHFHIDLKREVSFNRIGNNYKYLGQPLKLQSSANAFSLSIGIFL